MMRSAMRRRSAAAAKESAAVGKPARRISVSRARMLIMARCLSIEPAAMEAILAASCSPRRLAAASSAGLHSEAGALLRGASSASKAYMAAAASTSIPASTRRFREEPLRALRRPRRRPERCDGFLAVFRSSDIVNQAIWRRTCLWVSTDGRP